MNYFDVILGWTLIAVIILVMPICAFRFRKIAKSNNKRGWSYFILGLAAGFLSLMVGLLVFGFIMYQFISTRLTEMYSTYVFLLAIAIAYGGMFFFIRIFKTRFTRLKQPSAAHDSDLMDNIHP